jgi:ABC-type antimicrobial peptide transport system permease subunit
MKTLQLALVPGIIAGILSIFTGWFWMGVMFHRYQRLTPNTWRPENNRSYALSSTITFLSCIAIATVFLLVARMGGVFAGGLPGALRFAAVMWIALAAPLVVNAAVFINLHPWFVVGQVVNALTTSVLACTITAWWRAT